MADVIVEYDGEIPVPDYIDVRLRSPMGEGYIEGIEHTQDNIIGLLCALVDHLVDAKIVNSVVLNRLVGCVDANRVIPAELEKDEVDKMISRIKSGGATSDQIIGLLRKLKGERK